MDQIFSAVSIKLLSKRSVPGCLKFIEIVWTRRALRVRVQVRKPFLCSSNQYCRDLLAGCSTQNGSRLNSRSPGSSSATTVKQVNHLTPLFYWHWINGSDTYCRRKMFTVQAEQGQFNSAAVLVLRIGQIKRRTKLMLVFWAEELPCSKVYSDYMVV